MRAAVIAITSSGSSTGSTSETSHKQHDDTTWQRPLSDRPDDSQRRLTTDDR